MIPGTAHFIWFGRKFPWTHVLAIKSAAACGGFDRVVLHHADPLEGTCWWPDLLETPNFEARTLDPPALLAKLTNGAELRSLYDRLTAPEAKSDLCRMAILAVEGGVYLDLDTVCVRSLEPLREEAGFFCGQEWICWPGEVVRSRNPVRKLHSLSLDVLRYAFRLLPSGWKWFRSIENLYYPEVNNAIVGSAPGHPMVMTLLSRMAEVEGDLHRCSLGPHLLQRELRDGSNDVSDDVCIYPPSVFSPLPPEVSYHWFKRCRRPSVNGVLLPDTRVVHWYSSAGTRRAAQQLTPEFVHSNSERQLLSALATQILDSAAPETLFLQEPPGDLPGPVGPSPEERPAKSA